MQYIVLLALFSLACSTPVPYNPMINDGFFEGDMAGVELDEDRNAVPRDNQRWPNGVVPYFISSELSQYASEIRRAMDYIEMYSCVRFVQRSNQGDYIKIFRGEGCWSHWGRIGRENQLSIGEGCQYFGTYVHELLHAIGFEHEHNRSDRDDHLTIHWQNIVEKWYYAFKKLAPHENRLYEPFDIDSIMMYGSNAFAKKTGEYSMTKKNGEYIKDHKELMSWPDVYKIRKLYQCK